MGWIGSDCETLANMINAQYSVKYTPYREAVEAIATHWDPLLSVDCSDLSRTIDHSCTISTMSATACQIASARTLRKGAPDARLPHGDTLLIIDCKQTDLMWQVE